MTHAQLQALLQEDEGCALDFKQEQYRFSSNDDKDKAEVLKDILGFANNWRRAEALIVIGVEEVRAGYHRVCGVTEHLRDHELQQFINSKTNKPVQFSYETCDYGGLSVGVIRVAQQPRPFWLKKRFLNLDAEKVFIRRGTSTDPTKPATPDEIALMGHFTDAVACPSLEVALGSAQRDEVLSLPVSILSHILQIPPREQIPARTDEGTQISLPGGKTFRIGPAPARIYGDSLNPEYFRQRAAYEQFHSCFRLFRLHIRNAGVVAARNVFVELASPGTAGLLIREYDDAPAKPRRRESPLAKIDRAIAAVRPTASIGAVSIAHDRAASRLAVTFGDMQPGLPLWTEPFWLGCTVPEDVMWSGKLYADNLPHPLVLQFPLDVTTTHQILTIEEVLALPDVD